jgi:DNA polymerase
MDIAGPIFGKTYEEVEALGKKSKERTTGKVVQLSGIFGTGAAKMQSTLRIIGKVKVSQEEAQKMTDIYRGEYTEVVAAWQHGKDVLDAIYHKQHYGPFLRDILQVSPEGMMKPSGLLLAYPDLRWTRDKDDKMGYTYEQKRKTRDRVYGSKCFQRCVQSLARDIIGEHMLKIDKKYHVVGTVHDEIICVVPEAETEAASAFMLEVMRTPPAWAEGLPLDAEVGVGDNYLEAK